MKKNSCESYKVSLPNFDITTFINTSHAGEGPLFFDTSSGTVTFKELTSLDGSITIFDNGTSINLSSLGSTTTNLNTVNVYSNKIVFFGVSSPTTIANMPYTTTSPIDFSTSIDRYLTANVTATGNGILTIEHGPGNVLGSANISALNSGLISFTFLSPPNTAEELFIRFEKTNNSGDVTISGVNVHFVLPF